MKNHKSLPTARAENNTKQKEIIEDMDFEEILDKENMTAYMDSNYQHQNISLEEELNKWDSLEEESSRKNNKNKKQTNPFTTIFTLYDEAAKENDVYALNNLGCCYLNGEGTEQNYQKAITLIWQRTVHTILLFQTKGMSNPEKIQTVYNYFVNNVAYDTAAEKKSTQLIFSDISTPNGKNEKDFCVYEDVKKKLIEKGVPEKQIAFIHDCKTDAQKQALFNKMNKGEVRILLGSTGILGTGVNCQERLIAAHHLDCPWKPADLEQRNGRIIRQGNTNEKVDIYNYVTKGTFDSYLFQLVENKQRFISQIMTSKSPARSAEDVDESVLNYVQIKALAAGDTRIKEKMDLDIEVSKLRTVFASWQAEKRDMQSFLLTKYPEQLKECLSAIKGIETDIALADKTAGKEFKGMTVKGKFYSDKKEAGQALLTACTTVHGSEKDAVGEYRGFKAYVRFNPVSNEFTMSLKNESTVTFPLGNDLYGNITRMDNALAGLPNMKTKYENDLDTLEKNAANTKAQIEKPFDRLDELHEKEHRLEKLNAALSVSDGDKSSENSKPEKTAKKKDVVCL